MPCKGMDEQESLMYTRMRTYTVTLCRGVSFSVLQKRHEGRRRGIIAIG